jgi:hypothetical protein
MEDTRSRWLRSRISFSLPPATPQWPDLERSGRGGVLRLIRRELIRSSFLTKVLSAALHLPARLHMQASQLRSTLVQNLGRFSLQPPLLQPQKNNPESSRPMCWPSQRIRILTPGGMTSSSASSVKALAHANGGNRRLLLRPDRTREPSSSISLGRP